MPISPLKIQHTLLKTESPDATTGYIWGKAAHESRILSLCPSQPSSLSPDTIIAERWIVSDDAALPSQIIHSTHTTLNHLLADQGEEILGTEHIAKFGPYLGSIMKHLDTNHDPKKGGLSIQVHPAIGHPHRPPKPELWWGEGSVYIGWKQDMSPEQLRKAIQEGTVTSLMHKIHLSDQTYISVEGGTIHGIRAGSTLFEWSVSPTEQERALGSLAQATVSPFDRTDGKPARPGKEDVEGSIEVISHAQQWNKHSVSELLQQPHHEYADSTGQQLITLFNTPQLLVYRLLVTKNFTWNFPHAMSLFVHKGNLHIDHIPFATGEEGLLPLKFGDYLFEHTEEGNTPAELFLWSRRG